MTKKNNELLKQLKSIEDSYKKAEEQNSNYVNSISEHQKQVKDIKEENDYLKNEMEKLKKLLDQANDHFDRKNKEYLSLNDKLIKLENENNNFKKELPFWKEKYDKDIKNKSIEEERLKNKISNMSNQLDDLISKNNNLLNSNNDILSKNTELENDLKELYKNFAKVKDDNIILSKEIKEKLKIIQILNEGKKKLNDTLNKQLSQIKELEEKINNLIDEKKNLEYQIGESNCESNKLKDINEVNNRQIESLKTLLNTFYNIINECSDIIISYIQQLRKLAFSQDNKRIYYSEHYNHFINSCDILSSQKNISQLDKLKIIKSFLTESSIENFDWYKQISDLEEANRLLDDTNISLKNQICDYADTVNKANKYIEDSDNKFHHLLDNNYKFKQKHNDLVMKYNKQNEKINCITNELNNVQDKNNNLTCLVHQLNRENIFIDNQLNQTTNNLNILEKRFDIIKRERNSCENTLEKIIYPNSIINGNESFSNISNGNNDNSNIEYITSIPNNNKNNYDPNNYNTFFDTDTNKFQNSYLRNWTNETQRFSTNPNNDNINIEVNNGENGAN